KSLVEIANGHPVHFAVTAVHFADQGGELGLELPVGFDIAAGGNGNLQQRDRTLEPGLELKHPIECPDSVSEPFRIIEAIDAEDKFGAAQAFPQTHDFGAAHRLGGAGGKVIDVDTDRESRQLRQTPFGGDGAIDHVEAEFGLQIVLEILPVLHGLKADEIVSEHRARDFAMMRHSRHGTAGWPRRARQESERTLYAEPAQLRAKDEKVIVLDPKNPVRGVEAQERARPKRVKLALRGKSLPAYP